MTDPRACLECMGTGWVAGPADISRNVHDQERVSATKCPDCAGTGREPLLIRVVTDDVEGER